MTPRPTATSTWTVADSPRRAATCGRSYVRPRSRRSGTAARRGGDSSGCSRCSDRTSAARAVGRGPRRVRLRGWLMYDCPYEGAPHPAEFPRARDALGGSPGDAHRVRGTTRSAPGWSYRDELPQPASSCSASPRPRSRSSSTCSRAAGRGDPLPLARVPDRGEPERDPPAQAQAVAAAAAAHARGRRARAGDGAPGAAQGAVGCAAAPRRTRGRAGRPQRQHGAPRRRGTAAARSRPRRGAWSRRPARHAGPAATSCWLVPYDRAPQPVDAASPSSDIGRLRAGGAGARGHGARTTDHRRALELAARALRAVARAQPRAVLGLRLPARRLRATAAGDAPAASPRPTGPWDAARVYLVPLAPRSRANAALTDAVARARRERRARCGDAAVVRRAPPATLAVEARAFAPSAARRGARPRLLSLPASATPATLLPLARVPEARAARRCCPTTRSRSTTAACSPPAAPGTLHVLLREDGPPSPLRLALEAGMPASGLAVTPWTPPALPPAPARRRRDRDRRRRAARPAELQATLDFAARRRRAAARAGRARRRGVLERLAAARAGRRRAGRARPGAPAAAAWRLRRAVAGHPALDGLRRAAGRTAVRGALHARARVPRRAPHARVLLAFDRTHPALLEVPRRARARDAARRRERPTSR